MRKIFNAKTIQTVHLSTVVFALVVVGLGAFTRLENAGLGCPDWPKCYQNWIVHPRITTPALTHDASYKAWIEMIHRYAAGLLCMGIFYLNMWQNRSNSVILRITAICTCLQAAFGMWTVTWKLHPLAVMPHLMGGMMITALLSVDYFQRYASQNNTQLIPKSIHRYLHLLFIVVWLQIMLGGWTSANYAALVCPDFPLCQGQWTVPIQHLIQGFSAPFGFQNYEGGVLSGQGRIAIHVSHRMGALICCVIVGLLIHQVAYYRNKLPQKLIQMTGQLSILFALQIILGVLNVVWTLPISTALMHNLIALALLIRIVTMCTSYSAQSPPQTIHRQRSFHAD
jgi:cytochrome c oxidase assembly protein subunit 15